jgi:hypothetical protein
LYSGGLNKNISETFSGLTFKIINDRKHHRYNCKWPRISGCQFSGNTLDGRTQLVIAFHTEVTRSASPISATKIIVMTLFRESSV